MTCETTVKKATRDPIFNEDFKFKIDSYHLKSARLLIFVYSARILSRRNLLGCIMFGKKKLKILILIHFDLSKYLFF